jgi:hypothetical protein
MKRKNQPMAVPKGVEARRPARPSLRTPLDRARQARPALAAALCATGPRNGRCWSAAGPGAGARASRLLSQPRGPRHRLRVPPGPRGRLLRRGPGYRPGREVHARLCRPHSAAPEAQRQDQHPRRRRSGVVALGQRGGRGPAGRGRGRLHALRGLAEPGLPDPEAGPGPAGLRAARDAARALVVPARPRHRGQGRQGHRLRQDYAARVAEEMGADAVKLHEPEPPTIDARSRIKVPARAGGRPVSGASVRSAGRSSCSSRAAPSRTIDAAVLQKVRLYMDSGATASCSAAICGCARTTMRCR